MKKIGYYLKGIFTGIDYYLSTYSYQAIKSKEYCDSVHSSKGLESEKLEQWNKLHKDFLNSFPIVVGFTLSLISVAISIIALLIAIIK